MSSIIIYQDQDDFLFETLKDTFLNYKKIDCSTVDFDYFLKQNIPSLFNKNEYKIYYNLNHLDSNKMLEFILTDCSNNIFAFTKLDKRTKLYKKLLKDFKIIECEPIKGLISKKDFIKTLLIEYKLSLNNLDFFIDTLPENKMIILKELQKFKEIFELSGDINLSKKSIGNYQANYDIFELINSLFDQNCKKYYYYLNKTLLDCYSGHIFALFFKKILYYIYLKVDNIKEARNQIPVNDYFINKDINYIKNIRLDSLLGLYKFIEVQADPYSTKELRVRLLSIYRFFSINN